MSVDLCTFQWSCDPHAETCVWCSAALNVLKLLVVVVQCLFVSLHVTSSLQGNPFSYGVVLYVPYFVWHRSPSREEFQENSSVMLSQGRQVLLSQGHIFILNPAVLQGHKESNKTEQFSFHYSLYLHSVDWNRSMTLQDYIWHFVNMLNYL